VNINAVDFNFYWQQNYQVKMVMQNTLAEFKISGMLFTLDTNTNNTLRSFMSDVNQQNFLETMKELYLELALTIENPTIKVTLNKTGF